MILPEYDYILSPAFQRCLTNYNRFFKKQFPNYNLNEKVTPYIALVNPGNDKDISSLILNPNNLLLLEKVKNELDSDESLGQTLRLVATKKESEADIKYAIVKDSEEKATVISVPKDIDKTHPYTTNEVIKKVKETLELSLGPDNGFPYSKNNIYKYSDITIEYVSQVYIEEFKNN